MSPPSAPRAAPALDGLLALLRRKHERRAPGDDAAIARLDALVHKRARRRFSMSGGRARHPQRDEDCDDVAGDVMLRLVTRPERPLDALVGATGLRLDAPRADAVTLQHAERVAQAYITTMLRNRAAELLRRRGANLANPMRAEDVLQDLDQLDDPATGAEAEREAEARAFAIECREALDALASRLAHRTQMLGFNELYVQLWRLAGHEVSLAQLATEHGVAQAALHKRHQRARDKLCEAIDEERGRGVLDPPLAVALRAIVERFLCRRQTHEGGGVSLRMTSDQEDA